MGSFIMVKYSYELKRQVIQDYLDGLGGYKKLAQKYGLPTKSIILQWLNVYEHYGFEGLEVKRKKRTYSREFKLNAVRVLLRMMENVKTLNLCVKSRLIKLKINGFDNLK